MKVLGSLIGYGLAAATLLGVVAAIKFLWLYLTTGCPT